ncbi:TetR family transcriptional regulator [Desulfoluna limicola]|uniref:TetR family transcriptional regulator n=1 Tax=Desulfoluna limicola TaxID=2810562 RepID=A0ABM7PGN5_9BACT|nr:TetR/AcrR family transcriptional regulator [Desulfoluna limicola]BCS96355.1 TetR family transcriptional regulator [Desulfoluna limicola]
MNDTRTKILDVAEALIQQVGLNAMSYKHISDEVGIQKPSIHHHFPKKENLVNELLMRCHVTYGDKYQKIVGDDVPAPEKLRSLAGVYGEGLKKGKLCLVGTISSDLGTLQSDSRNILENTIRKTVKTFAVAFEQGRKEETLVYSGSPEEAAYAFFSFLLGAQITARAYGGADRFRGAAEAMISSWEW